MKFAVIVKQSSTDQKVKDPLAGYSVYGPFDHEGEADERMEFINSLAEEGMFNVDRIVVAAIFDQNDPAAFVKQLMED